MCMDVVDLFFWVFQFIPYPGSFLFFIVSSAGVVGTSGTALAMENYGHSAGSASALLGLFGLVFGAMLAPLVGIAGSNTALPMGIIIAVIDLSALLCYLVLKKR